ncbi:MAG: leucine-rich repeat domain-containing protein [Paludibacteraceae bacterium]
MKRFTLFLLSVLCATATTFAYNFQSGDLYYNITSNTTVEVTCLSYDGDSYQGGITIPESVNYNGITYAVTGIGYIAFWDCSSLTSVTIPTSVTRIGQEAFRYCYSLTSVTIPNSVTWIGTDAFGGVSNVVYHGTATGSPWGARSVNGYVEGYLVYADETKTALLACSAAATGEIIIPNSVTSIGNSAFRDCSNLTSIIIPNSVTSIGYRAFSGCYSLTSVSVPNSVTTIGEEAFSYVPNVEYNGTATGSPWGARSLNGYVEDYLVYADETKTNLLACSAAATGEITISDSVTSLGYYAFYNCSYLTSITIGNGVTAIGVGAFRNCSGLTTISIPNSVTSIGEWAFGDCSGLSSVTIGSSVTSIGDIAFGYCSSLADIYCYATTPPSCGDKTYTFTGVSKHCYIHVPAGTIRDYQMAYGWRDFYHFYEISELPDGAPSDQVGVTVTGNYATFSWPVTPTASSYTLTITKDGEVFCTLIFNNMGQLVGMAFAPARDGKPSANQSDAQSTAYGFSFVVTNLDANSHYTYTFTVNGADSEVIETYSGSFDTTEETALPATQQNNHPSRKVLHNGQVLILRNGETYDIMGQRL